MKKGKNKKARPGKDELRVGNFVFKAEDMHIKLYDISGMMTHRVSVLMPLGRLLDMAVKARNVNFLHNYAAMMYNVSCVVPDETFFIGIHRECQECIIRHKSLYGMKEEVSVEEDERILKEERELYEAIEEINGMDSKN